MALTYLQQLEKDLEAPVQARGFGSGWISGFFALLLAITGFCLVAAMRWPMWFSMPQLLPLERSLLFRFGIHLTLLTSYILALLSLLLRPRKTPGFTALGIGILATILGGANVQPHETHNFGIYFGIDFFVVNLIVTGLMFAPIERLYPHRKAQRLFRIEWREDLFYYLISSMLVQLLTFLELAPSTFVMTNTGAWHDFRAAVGGQPWALQLAEAMFLTDLAQYWFHRAFHRIPFLWGFHAVHHSAKAMDWMAGARMHFVEIVLLRSVTSLPLMTMGFSPSVMQAYIAIVYVYSALVHANLGGDLNWLGNWIVIPRFHHWHHGLEDEAIDVNFAIHFPWIDKVFGTYFMPASRWPENYGVPERVPNGYWKQAAYPFVRRQPNPAE